jgi:hypothetical protein
VNYMPRDLHLKARMLYLLMTITLFACSGASCPRSRQIVNDYAPIVLQPEATLADVIRVVNFNSSRVQQIQSHNATLSVPGAPRLDASYAFERPKRFRLRAETRIRGAELDLGSNDSIYWMWVRMNDAVYWGSHASFYRSAARQVLPVSPDWLIEALGVVELDPTGDHEGPFRGRPGQLEVRTRVVTPAGTLTRITVVDDARGWVLEQQLYDDRQQLVAAASASGFEFDPVTGVSLPRVVEIRVPAADLNFTLQTERHLVNQLTGDPGQLWTLPEISGVPQVNLDAQPGHGVARQPVRPDAPPQRMASRYLRTSDDAAVRRLPPFHNLK